MPPDIVDFENCSDQQYEYWITSVNLSFLSIYPLGQLHIASFIPLYIYHLVFRMRMMNEQPRSLRILTASSMIWMRTSLSLICQDPPCSTSSLTTHVWPDTTRETKSNKDWRQRRQRRKRRRTLLQFWFSILWILIDFLVLFTRKLKQWKVSS